MTRRPFGECREGGGGCALLELRLGRTKCSPLIAQLCRVVCFDSLALAGRPSAGDRGLHVTGCACVLLPPHRPRTTWLLPSPPPQSPIVRRGVCLLFSEPKIFSLSLSSSKPPTLPSMSPAPFTLWFSSMPLHTYMMWKCPEVPISICSPRQPHFQQRETKHFFFAYLAALPHPPSSLSQPDVGRRTFYVLLRNTAGIFKGSRDEIE